jgi:hypothetical protein
VHRCLLEKPKLKKSDDVSIIHTTLVSFLEQLGLSGQFFVHLRPICTCNFCCDFLLLMHVNEWMSYECLDEGTHTQNIRYSFTHSHASEEENCIRNRNKRCKCERAFILISESVFCNIPPYKIDAQTYLYIP